MAVTQNSDGNSKQPVEEGVEPSSREGADAGPCGLIQLRKSDGDPGSCSDKGPSTGHRDINKNTCGMVKSYKLRRNRIKDNESDGLSDIDDAEVFGYLNTKEEIHYKRILWEAMNGKYTKAKKQKRTTETKKGVSVKKAAKTTEKVEFQRPSSRINYDALKILNDELKQGSEMDQIIRADSYAHGTENSPDGNISHGMHGSNGSSYKEDQHDISYCKDNETFGHHDGEMCHEYGDELFNDEYFDF
ncbi:hypothetical protein Pfo_025041 [Paulownia fortunei]|nr:hypothetical protein Pfo_025041 [Paulownia fortunei]